MLRTDRVLSFAFASLIVLVGLVLLPHSAVPHAIAQSSTVTPVRTEQAGLIRFGVPVEGVLDDTVFRQVWRFEAISGAVVDIRMQAISGNLDPSLVLLSPLGDVLRTNDSASGGLDAGILAFQLPFTGEYQIVARRGGEVDGRGGRTSGGYRLTLDLRSPGTAAENTLLLVGRTVEGRLTDEQPRAVYRLELGGALALRLDLDGANRMAAMRLLTPSGALLGAYQGLSPLDIALNLPTSGIALVEVSAPSYEERPAADFALSLYRLAPRSQPPQTLQYGRARYAEAPSVLNWFFIGTAGDVLALSVQPETFSGALEVDVTVGIPNELPLFRGVLGIGFEQVFTLPSTGAYSIELRAASTQRFRYSVLLKQIGANGLPFDRFAILHDQGSLVFNTPISDSLPRGEVQSRWLDVTTERVITVRAAPRSSADKLGVAILSPGGALLTASTSRAERGAVLQNVLLPQMGRYRVAVFELALQTNRSAPIDYTLRIEETDGGTLRPAEPVKGIARRANGLSIWEVRTAANSLINVRLENLTPAVWQPELFILSPNGVVIAAARGETSRDQALTILGADASESGTYRVVVGGKVIGDFAAYRLVSGVQQPFEPPSDREIVVAPLPTLGALERYAPTPTPPPIRLSVAAQLSPLVNPSELPADQVTPLPFNTTVRGEISRGGLVQAWSINSGSNVVVQLRATALEGDVAPRLTLWDRNGRVLAEQFNAQGASTFFTYRIVQGGSYTLVVNMGLNGGRYLLTLDSQPLTETLRVIDGVPLAYGQSLTAELQSSLETDTYFFLGTLNDVISVQAVRITGRLAPALSLIGPNGREIAANSPPDGRYYAELSNVRLPDSGLFRLVVSNLNRSERVEGRYTLSLGLLSATRLQSRGGGVISEGEVRSGFLLAGDNEDTWLFRARRGQRVSFIAFAAEPPSPAPLSLQLLDTSGQVFAAQTRTLSQSSIRLEDVLLPEDGLYRVRVVGGTQTQGVYRLQWRSADERAGGVIGYGQTVSGILTAARNFETWVFSGNAGDVVSVGLRYIRGTPFMASFQLRAANGVALATVADLDGSGARADVLLPFDGSYSIVVANPALEFSGASIYALSLGLMESRARAIGGVLRYGEAALSTLYADDGTDTWVFAAQAGERVRVRVQALDRFLVPYLELRSATDEVLAAAMPEPLPLATARIGGDGANDFVIPADGAYALIVQAMAAEDGSASTGSYRLSLDFMPRPVAEIDRLSYGSAVNGVLADDRPHETYLFEGRQADVITAHAVREPGASLSLQLQLWSADGQILAQADSDDSDSAALRAFRLPYTGEYRLIVLRFGGPLGQTAGRYTIRLEGAEEVRPLRSQVRYAQQVLGRLSENVPIDRFAFDGQRGDVISIITRATSGDLDTLLRLEREDGSLIASNDDADGVNAVLNGVQLPEDGRYIVVVERLGSSAGNYELFVNLLYQNTAAEAIQAAQLITYGARVVGTLDAQTTELRYAFRGAQGDRIAVQMLHQTDDAPPILELREPSGRLLGSGALGVGRTALNAFTLPADGFYQLLVRRPLNSRARFSPFALTLDLESISAPRVSGLNGGILTPESSVIGTFAPSETAHYWLLSGTAGQSLSLNTLRLSGEGLPS
ncbi:MAG: PPC domain-containing protein, partial [Aggregatilineales bacterium]